MPRTIDISVMEKQRIRAEISCRVEEFLRRRGQIEVLTKEGQPRPVAVSRIWHSDSDLTDLSD
jgi:hypothetical protein